MNRLKNRRTLFLLIVLILGMIAATTACAPSDTQAEPAAPQDIQRVTLEDSKAALESGSAVFLDVRSQEAYATSHIPGAVSIPLAELEARTTELDPNQWIITYCT